MTDTTEAAGGRTDAGNGSATVVGVIGLGTMGGGMARHLLAAGYEVVGHDVDPGAAERFEQHGGSAASSAADVGARADIVILSLPSVRALQDVVGDGQGLAGARRATVAVEASTLPISDKEAARDALGRHGVVLLDCPISGTGAQMAAGDAVFYASGDPAAVARVSPVLAVCGRGVFDLGAFGNGTRLKLVANHLVTVHNASAAEALALAGAGGIEPGVALPALVAGAGTSRMLELRGPMMVARHYEPASMKVELYMKDVGIITAFAAAAGCSVPVFDAAARLHQAALDAGWAEADTASVYEVVSRPSPQ